MSLISPLFAHLPADAELNRAYPVNADTHYMRYVSSVNRRGGRRCIEEVI
jgi:hypothetical protein